MTVCDLDFVPIESQWTCGSKDVSVEVFFHVSKRKFSSFKLCHYEWRRGKELVAIWIGCNLDWLQFGLVAIPFTTRRWVSLIAKIACNLQGFLNRFNRFVAWWFISNLSVSFWKDYSKNTQFISKKQSWTATAIYILMRESVTSYNVAFKILTMLHPKDRWRLHLAINLC